jgi:hypothetical protein
MSAGNWWDPDPVYTEQTLHLIGVGPAVAGIFAFAWIARLFVYAKNEYGDWAPAATKPPFWFYVGAAALFVGLHGAIITRFRWSPNPVFLIMAGIGLVIVVIFRVTRKPVS